MGRRRRSRHGGAPLPASLRAALAALLVAASAGCFGDAPATCRVERAAVTEEEDPRAGALPEAFVMEHPEVAPLLAPDGPRGVEVACDEAADVLDDLAATGAAGTRQDEVTGEYLVRYRDATYLLATAMVM